MPYGITKAAAILSGDGLCHLLLLWSCQMAEAWSYRNTGNKRLLAGSVCHRQRKLQGMQCWGKDQSNRELNCALLLALYNTALRKWADSKNVCITSKWSQSSLPDTCHLLKMVEKGGLCVENILPDLSVFQSTWSLCLCNLGMASFKYFNFCLRKPLFSDVN